MIVCTSIYSATCHELAAVKKTSYRTKNGRFSTNYSRVRISLVKNLELVKQDFACHYGYELTNVSLITCQLRTKITAPKNFNTLSVVNIDQLDTRQCSNVFGINSFLTLIARSRVSDRDAIVRFFPSGQLTVKSKDYDHGLFVIKQCAASLVV